MVKRKKNFKKRLPPCPRFVPGNNGHMSFVSSIWKWGMLGQLLRELTDLIVTASQEGSSTLATRCLMIHPTVRHLWLLKHCGKIVVQSTLWWFCRPTRQDYCRSWTPVTFFSPTWLKDSARLQICLSMPVRPMPSAVPWPLLLSWRDICG